MPSPIRNRRRLNGLSTASFATSANSLHVRGSEFADQPLQGLPTPPFDPRWGGGLQPGNASPGLPSDLPSSGGGSCGHRCLRSTLCAGEFRLRPLRACSCTTSPPRTPRGFCDFCSASPTRTGSQRSTPAPAVTPGRGLGYPAAVQKLHGPARRPALRTARVQTGGTGGTGRPGGIHLAPGGSTVGVSIRGDDSQVRVQRQSAEAQLRIIATAAIEDVVQNSSSCPSPARRKCSVVSSRSFP